MDLGAILPGRIPGSLVVKRLNQAIKETQRELTRLQDTIATGQKFFLPSEDTAAASKTITLQAQLERTTQFATSAQTNQSFLSTSDQSLSSFSDVLNRARQLASSGVGSLTQVERDSLIVEIDGLIRQSVNIGNTSFRGRSIFGGSQSASAPYTLGADAIVRYGGDSESIQSIVGYGTLVVNNISGAEAIGGFSVPAGADLNPGVSLQTKISDLRGGTQPALGSAVVSLSATSQSLTVDLQHAVTLADVKTAIEAAFAPGAVTVSLNSAGNGLQIAAASGTVSVANVELDQTAQQLGLVGGPAAGITGADLDPRLSLTSPLSVLNGSTGISTAAGTGLRIVNGTRTSVVDLSTATTVEDVINAIRQADPDVQVGFNASRTGISISTRLSGVDFSIGENGGTTASTLGVLTFSPQTRLSEFGHGVGVNLSEKLQVTRRDGSSLEIDLSGSATVQNVLDKINAVDPGNLTASLATVGNGFVLVDNSGTGPLSVSGNEIANQLGLSGTESGANPAVPLSGRDPNPREATGALTALVRLRHALESGNTPEIERAANLLDFEVARVAQVRGEVGSRLKILDSLVDQLSDQKILIAESLDQTFSTDLAEALTELSFRQTAFQATLQVASQNLRLTILDYL